MAPKGKALARLSRKREQALREANDSVAGRLESWQERLARYLAELGDDTRTAYDLQAHICSDWAGRPVTVEEVKNLRDRKAFRTLKYSIRAANKEYTNEATAIMREGSPAAARLQVRAVQELNDAQPGKLDIRAIPAITAPFLGPLEPKKNSDAAPPPVINIVLTTFQASNREMPYIEVEAVEVEPEESS